MECVGVDSAVSVGGKDRWGRLMSARIEGIVTYLMNECKLATVELIPPFL